MPQQAVDMGLVHRAVPGDGLEAAVQEEIDMIRLGGPNAVIECKKLVREVLQLDREAAFELTAPWSGQPVRLRRGGRRHGGIPGQA